MQRIPSILRRVLPALTLCAAAIAPGVSQAAYPEQPIKMIVAYAAGGGTDIIARLTAQYLQKHLGNNASIAVINRPGAGGGIGFTELTLAKVRAVLADLPLEWREGSSCTGAVAVLKGANAGPSVLLLGDMEALPIT